MVAATQIQTCHMGWTEKMLEEILTTEKSAAIPRQSAARASA